MALENASGEPRESVQRFYALHAGIAGILAVVVLGSFEVTNLDRWIQDFFYDPVARLFPHRSHWLFETAIHDFGKLSVIILGGLLFTGFLLSYKIASLASWRRPLLYGVLCLALCPVVVRQIKHSTGIHCPRALAIYGGSEPYVRIFDALPADHNPGHCWPGGHSSGGFAMMSLYFVFRRRRPRLAQIWLVGGFLYGFTLGFGRVVYGAHFVSHSLWAAAVCWTVSLVLHELMLRRHEIIPSRAPERAARPLLSTPYGKGVTLPAERAT